MKDTHDLGFKFRKFDGEDGAARVEDKIATLRQQVDVAAKDVSHTTLDAIALVSLADDLAHGEPDAGAFRLHRARAGIRLTRSEEPTHRRGLPFAGGSIGALIIGVLAQAHARQGLRRGLWDGWAGSLKRSDALDAIRPRAGRVVHESANALVPERRWNAALPA
jgi:hypothetical protein